MNLSKYVEDAIRTESRIESVTVHDLSLFLQTLEIFIASGTLLDKFKKNVFYGKPIAPEDVEKELRVIDEEAEQSWIAGRPATLSVDPRVFHSLIGIATEATELMEALRDTLNGNGDGVNILEEFGDVNWYEAIGIDALGGDFEAILNTNIEKLRKRFPEKFTSEEAINRNIEEERNTLETGLTKIS